MMEGDGSSRPFGCSLMEMRELMQTRGHEGYEKLQTELGGVRELCKKLYTSPNEGISLESLIGQCWIYSFVCNLCNIDVQVLEPCPLGVLKAGI